MSGDASTTVGVSTIRRGWWLAFARSTDHAAVFIVQILIARWIGPDDFGAFAAALLVLTIVDSATESGIATALVQRDEIEREHLDVAWTFALLRGVMLATAMLLAAPLVAGMVGSPESAPLIRWLAIVPVLRALCSPALVTLQRALAYRRLAIASLIETVAMFAVTLALVPVLDGPWPLVCGIIAGEVGRLAASYALAPHRLRPSFDRRRVADLLRYGRWVTGSSIALLLLLYMDDAMVATLLGAGALAVYQVAYQVAGIPASEISLVVGEVAFTSMARLRDDSARLARSFLQSYELVAGIAIPVAVALAVTASPTVSLLLGPKWDGAVPVIQVLAAWGVLRALGALTTALFRAVGRPDIPARHHWRMVLCTGVLLVPMIEVWGIVGAAWAVLVPNLAIHWLRYRDVAAVLDVRQERILDRLKGPVIAGVLMGIAMAAVCLATASLWPGWTLLAAAVAGSATYLLAMAVLERTGRSHALRSVRLLTRGAST